MRIRSRPSSIFSSPPLTLAAINAVTVGQDVDLDKINGKPPVLFESMDGGQQVIVPTPPATDITPTHPGIFYNANTGALQWFDGSSTHDIAFV